MISGPPPGAFMQLMGRWRKYIAWWMLEKLSPPEPKPRVDANAPSGRAAAKNGEWREERPEKQRATEPLRWRPRNGKDVTSSRS